MNLNNALPNQNDLPKADYFEEEQIEWDVAGFQDNDEFDIDPSEITAALHNLQQQDKKQLILKDAIKLDR